MHEKLENSWLDTIPFTGGGGVQRVVGLVVVGALVGELTILPLCDWDQLLLYFGFFQCFIK